MKEIEAYKLSMCHPDSVRMDLGSWEIYVALSPAIAAEMDSPIVQVFNTYTQGLNQCKELLVSCDIKTVSMESTSVYWTTIHSRLQYTGIEACLVYGSRMLNGYTRLPVVTNASLLWTFTGFFQF